MVIETGWCLLTRADMERFEQMCEDGLLGPSDYGIFEDWLAIDRLRDWYLRIKDGIVTEGEIQEMEDKENHYDKEPYKACVHAFFLAYHEMRTYRWWLLFRPMELEHYCEFKVSLVQVMYLARLFIFLVLMERNFSIGMRIRQA